MQTVETLDHESRMILDSIPGQVALLTATGEVDVVNRQLLEYFGQTLEELKGWGSNGTVHPDDLPHVVDVFSRSIQTGTPYEIIQRLRRGDGTYRWMQNSGFPLRRSDASISRWCVLLTDIDDRRRTEESLRQSERDLKLIIDTMPALTWTAGPDGRLDFFNQLSLDYLGLTAEEATAGAWTKAVHPDDEHALAAAWKRILRSEKFGETEERLRRYDGEYRWLLLRANPLFDESGKVVRWYGVNIDIEDRKQSETHLKESEQQFRTLFEEAGAGITLLDLTRGTPIKTNRAMQMMLDATEEELRNVEKFTELTAAEDRELDLSLFVQLRQGKRDALRQEKHFILKDGRSVWANANFTLLRDASGEPRSVISIHEDITERKLAIQELQANQELLDLAQKSAGAMAFDWYIQEEVNHWSPEQEALFGLAPGTFDGTYKTWKRMMHAPDWPNVVAAIQKAHETGVVEAEYRVVWPDGSLHWLSTNGRMFFDEKGEPLRMVGFTSDVTRRKLVEEELRHSEALLAEAERISSTGSFSWRVSSDEVTWSEQLYRIYDLEPGIRITPALVRTRIHPEDESLYERMMEEARGGGQDFEFQYRLRMPDETVKYLHAVAHAMTDQDGGLEYIAAVQDVTQRHLSDEALSVARSELAHAARAMSLGVLTASIAHEVNQPLSGIITNANTCVRMLDAEQANVAGARETALRTIRDGNRAADVVTRLRALFGRKPRATEIMDLNDAAREVIALSQGEIQRNQVTLDIELAPALPSVVGDRVQLQQVILNFLINGMEAMSDVSAKRKRLSLRTFADEANILLSVADTGKGFAGGEAERIFDPFFTTKPTGMGIGLSVSRSIVEGHHGRIWAETNDGSGAVFSFSLPIDGGSASK